MNFSSDLCTLPTLTESTLLSSVEQRYEDQLTESYVGGVLLSLGPSTGPQFLPSFASSVLRSLAFSFEDQTILISGHHTNDKTKLCYDLLSALLTHLEQQPSALAASVLVATELLDYLCSSAEDECGRAVMVHTLIVSPANLTLKAARMSCLLLDTSSISQFKVLRVLNGIQYVESCLTKLGMEPWLLRQVCLVLGVVQGLLTGTSLTRVLKEVHIPQLPSSTMSGECLAQLLYIYLVHWIVSWMNSYALGAESMTEICCISVVYAPGHSCYDSQPMQSSTLSALVTRYANEMLHNLYCTRLFVWEQEQYLEEGIEWDTVEVEFNQNLVNTFHEEGGLFEVFAMSHVEEMRDGVRKCCELSCDSCFMLANAGDTFTLDHFTGENEYVIDGKWVETSGMHVAGSGLQAALLSSSCDVLVDMVQKMKYSPDVLPSGERIDSCRLTERAKAAMDSVCELITTSQPHFVFCFKPSKDEVKAFSREFVLSQLQQFKLLDIALIQSCGFPVRLKHSNFLKNYDALFVHKNQALSDVEKCNHILCAANLKEWHVGNTMVMLKPWHLSQLDAALDLFNQSAKKLQRVFRQSILRKKHPFLTTHSHSMESAPTYSMESVAPTPPPRPGHTLESPKSQPSSSPVHGDYDKASSPSTSPVTSRRRRSNPSSSPPASRRKKMSWKKTSSSNKARPISTTSDIQSYMWFQGKLSREKAEERLKGVQFDCFLIRESESRVGEYALSLRHDGIIKHFRIDTKHGTNPRYELYGAKRSFSSLDALADYYSHHCISSGGELLTTPFSTETQKQGNSTPLKRKLSSIRRPKPSLVAIPVNEQRLPRTKTTPTLNSSSHPVSTGMSSDLSDDSIAMLRRELEVEERIVVAARRMAELPTSNRRERQKRKQSLQQAQSRLLSLRQQFHTLQERKRFIEISMLNTSTIP